MSFFPKTKLQFNLDITLSLGFIEIHYAVSDMMLNEPRREKTGLWVSDHVQHKPAYAVTEAC